LKLIFDLGAPGEKANGIFCEWGRSFCSIGAYDEKKESITSLKYFTFDHSATTSVINDIVGVIKDMQAPDARIVFAFAFPEQVLVPRKFRQEYKFVDSLYETNNVFEDQVGEWALVNQYSLPGQLVSVIRENFPSAFFYHTQTPWLKNHNGFDNADQLMADFSPKEFRVLVKKGGALQLAQIYSYESPLDVVYYLLKIVELFEISKDNVWLIISGLVEENSALYRELHQYFLNTHFAKPARVSFESDHPQHFFSSLLNLAACAS
jgi:hypothetical protein